MDNSGNTDVALASTGLVQKTGDAMHNVLGRDGLAMPPLDMVANNYVANITAWVLGIMLVGYLLWGLAGAKRRVIVPAMLLGGFASSIIEPFLDVTSGCFYPIINQQNTLFIIMGRSIPLWVVECYAVYYGGFGALNLLAFNRGISKRGVWLWFLAPLLGDVLLEQVLLHFNLYTYYGNQALLAGRFPLYQPACNSTGELLAVTVMFFLRSYLRSWRWFVAAVVVMPLAFLMGFNVVAWPTDFATHSNWSYALSESCGVLSWAIALLMVYGASLLVASDSPLRVSGRLVLE